MCGLFGEFMSGARFAKALTLVVVFLCTLPVRSQVTVYQNGADPAGVAAQEAVEYGDEVNLVGSARILSKIRFEYFGDFYPDGDETVCLRIYANNGPLWKGSTDYPTPGTLLWESGFFPIQPGGAVKELPVPSIRVQDRFTWTVEFGGLSMKTNVVTLNPNVTNDYAGLLFYGNAEIGSSFNDFWERLTNGWTPVRVQSVAHNNFGVAVTALAEAVIPKLTVETYRMNYVLVKWPRAASDYKLQFKTKVSGSWFNVSAAPAVVGDYYNRVLDLSSGMAFFRLTQVAPPEPTLSITNEGKFVRVSWPGASSGFVLQSKESPGAAIWKDEYTPAAAVSNRFEVLLVRDSFEEVFRLREETKAASMEILPGGTNSLKIRWPATAKGYALQSKPAVGAQFWTFEGRPTNAVGNYFEVTLPVGEENKVFRLVH
jgi:hypothetical protein